MKKSLLTLLILVLALSFADAKEITQITGGNPHYLISVTHGGTPIGEIEIELFPEIAPKHCMNFDSLVGIKFYDRTAFHRVIPNFMIQGGDPNSRDGDKSTWGFGDPSQTKVPAEFSTKKHLRGIMSAARATDPNSATSQFFICVAAATHLNGQYSVYGEAVAGMDVVDAIVNVPRDMTTNNPNQKVEMTIVKIDPSSVNEIAVDNSIQIYPNPATDKLSFRSKLDGLAISEIQISDITGQIYINDANINNQDINQLSIPVDHLSVGAYMLKLKDSNNKVHNLRFVIQ